MIDTTIRETNGIKRIRELEATLSIVRREATEAEKLSVSRRQEVDDQVSEFHRDEVINLRQQLHAANDELNRIRTEGHMKELDQQQEIKKLQWEQECERNRLKWDQEQEADRMSWDHRQTLMQLKPTAQKLQKELEEVTARLLDAQEDNRALQAKFEADHRVQKLDQAKLQLRVMEMAQEIDEKKAEEPPPASPNKSTMCGICMDQNVSLVYPCGHAKCTDCANKLVGMGQGCPECRAPLTNPVMLFLNVG